MIITIMVFIDCTACVKRLASHITVQPCVTSHTHACMHARTHTHTQTHTPLHTHTHTQHIQTPHTHTHTHACTQVCTHTHNQTHKHKFHTNHPHPHPHTQSHILTQTTHTFYTVINICPPCQTVYSTWMQLLIKYHTVAWSQGTGCLTSTWLCITCDLSHLDCATNAASVWPPPDLDHAVLVTSASLCAIGPAGVWPLPDLESAASLTSTWPCPRRTHDLCLTLTVPPMLPGSDVSLTLTGHYLWPLPHLDSTTNAGSVWSLPDLENASPVTSASPWLCHQCCRCRGESGSGPEPGRWPRSCRAPGWTAWPSGPSRPSTSPACRPGRRWPPAATNWRIIITINNFYKALFFNQS